MIRVCLQVFVLKRNTSAPILTAFINMPVSETLLVGWTNDPRSTINMAINMFIGWLVQQTNDPPSTWQSTCLLVGSTSQWSANMSQQVCWFNKPMIPRPTVHMPVLIVVGWTYDPKDTSVIYMLLVGWTNQWSFTFHQYGGLLLVCWTIQWSLESSTCQSAYTYYM